MADLRLEILKSSRDGTNGHITVTCRIRDDSDPVTGVGALEICGIDPLELVAKYNGDPQAWLAVMGREMAERHRQRTAVVADLSKLTGKSVDIG